MPSTLLQKCATVLAERKLTVACAESATAGRLCSEFALVPESGKILKGGVVCYDVAIKVSLLGISQSLIDQFSPESAEVTAALSERLATVIEADVYVGITGLTTPGGSETPEKPVGSMFIDVWHDRKHTPLRETYSGPAEEIMLAAIDGVARLILKVVES